MEKRFEMALLLQSVLMIVAQLLLLELMVRLRSGALESTNEHYTLFGIILSSACSHLCRP